MWVVKSEKFCYQWFLWLKRTGRGEFQANRTTGWPANIWSKSTRSVRFGNIGNHQLFQNDFIYIIQWVYVFRITFKIMVLDFSKSHWTGWLWPRVCRLTGTPIGLKFTAPGSLESKNEQKILLIWPPTSEKIRHSDVRPMKRKIFKFVESDRTIFISFDSSDRVLENEHDQSENLENVQFRTINFFFTITQGSLTHA